MVSIFCQLHIRTDRLCFFFDCPAAPRDLHSFPTRRSSDLGSTPVRGPGGGGPKPPPSDQFGDGTPLRRTGLDRKSTRLNSSHLGISYAVFCLKKKKHISSHKYRASSISLDRLGDTDTLSHD